MNSLSFSTASLPDDDAFAAYHDLYAPVADAAALGPDFAVGVDAHRLGSLILFDRRMRAVSHSRSPRRAARSGFDHFTLQVVLSGSMRVSTENGDRHLAAGELALIDMDRSMRTEVDRANVLTLSVPRPVLERLHANPSRLHGAAVPGGRAGLLRDFLRSCLRHRDAGSDPDRIGRALHELLALTLDVSGEDASARQDAVDTLVRGRARAAIDAEPGLGPDDLARALGRSRSALYRAFEQEGGVARFIQSRRLGALRSRLGDRTETRSVAELGFACGFVSPSHCSRAFRAAYGLSPRAYRALRHEVGSRIERADDTVSERLGRWWSDLR